MAERSLVDKIPPQNLEAEKAVLGSMLIEKEAIPKTIEILQSGDFYKEAHQLIYQTILSLYDKGEAVDALTLSDELKKQSYFKEVGGGAYITSLINSVTTAAHVETYAKIVHEKSMLRKLIETATNIVSISYDDSEEVEALIDKAEEAIFKIADRKIGAGFLAVKDLVNDTIDELEKTTGNRLVTGVPTGYYEFDEKTSGLQPGNLVIIAGRPSMGKTSLVLGISMHAAIEQKIPVAFFSLEMSCKDLAMRLLCSEAKVSMQKLRGGFSAKNEWVRITNAASRLVEAPLFIDDSPSLSVLEMKARARRLKHEHGLGLVVIDYLQLMPGRSGRIEYRQQDISDITRALKVLSKELEVPVIALSQLNRSPEKRTEGKRPQLADLRESGAIEQDADVVAFIYREEYYKRQSNQEVLPDEKGIAEIIIGKQRNGPTGIIKLNFLEEFARFENLQQQPLYAAVK
jgi:replicative DNA helicase